MPVSADHTEINKTGDIAIDDFVRRDQQAMKVSDQKPVNWQHSR